MPTYHLELRKFPKTLTRFNQSGQQIGAIVLPWIQERILDIDGEKWAPYESTILILEGPAIPVDRLSMGRGWRTALREGTDVTERILAEARQALADGGATAADAPATPVGPMSSPQESGPAEDYPTAAPAAHDPADGDQLALGVQLGGLLGGDPIPLLAAWRELAGRSSGLAPSESLALAERELARRHGDRP
ncbi:MAG TPA: hypothetical protein VH061_14550 [Solirubrobacteraceae bacterium]|jgi:hypothetical protein|nr:hypothetical protein [Solirubrobacteraceae bacterium]